MPVYLDNYKSHSGLTPPIQIAPVMEVDIIMDILDGCPMKCPACFVNKKNSYYENDLKIISNLTGQFKDRGLEANELFLGPTDVFASGNFLDVMTSQYFEQLLQQYVAFTFTSTLLSNSEDIKKKVDIFGTMLDKHNKSFELFFLFDTAKYIQNDRSYLDLIDKNLEIVSRMNTKNRGNKYTNIQFVSNYRKDIFKHVSYLELYQKIKKDYGVKFRLNPSFARSEHAHVFKKYSLDLKETLEGEINDKSMKHLFINMLDARFGGETYFPLCYTSGELFISPYFYDFIPLKSESTKISLTPNGTFDIAEIFSTINLINIEQYAYAEETSECHSCDFLPNCVGRKTIQLMKKHNIKECLVPKKFYKTNINQDFQTPRKDYDN